MEQHQPLDQLAIISEMIQTARKQFNEKGTIFLMWGWAVTIAAVAQFVLIQMDVEENAWPWLLMPLTAIAQFFVMRKESKEEKVKTHVGAIMGRLWLIVGLSIGLTLVMSYFLGKNTYPILLMLYAIGTFVTGSALRVNALVYGAIACWLMSVVSYFIDLEYQLLLLAAAMVVSYIIPGYVLNARYKKANR
jgi:hypothetical protein